jgi:pimeloyl-ACP methyl ester carboxylesterase
MFSGRYRGRVGVEVPARPFAIRVEDAVLADLRGRLSHTRWPAQVDDAGWEQGTERETLRSLVAYWADGFDWRAYERELNALPHFKADIRGLGIHFVHERAARGPGLPILLVNGWPSTFVEELPLLPLLTDPQAHGIAGPAYDVVIPSLPGYGFSDRSAKAGMTPRATAGTFVELMRGLGYERFVAHGSDFGAEVLTQLALLYPQHLAGLHLSTFDWRPYLGPESRPLSPAEREYLTAREGWVDGENAYDELQSTKPQSLGYALNDSPAGLAGWMLEKWRSWSDCGGDVIGRFGRDFLLAMLTIYWVTETATSAARLYYDHRRYQPPLGPGDHVDVPTAVALFHHNFVTEGVPPREWAQRLFNICRWTNMPRGGHFAASEEPLLLATDIATFYEAAGV